MRDVRNNQQSFSKPKLTLVRLIFRMAKTASALKSTPGPSSSEKTTLVCHDQ